MDSVLDLDGAANNQNAATNKDPSSANKSPAAKESPSLPTLKGDERQLVMEHLARVSNDPTSLEIAEWFDARQVLMGLNRSLPAPVAEAKASPIRGYESGIFMHLRWREKNILGAKILREGVFLIKGGKVVNGNTIGTGDTWGLPRDQALGWVMAQMGSTAAERIGSRLTRTIVRGTVTYKGKAVTNGLWVVFNYNGAIHPDQVGQQYTMQQWIEDIGREAWEEEYGKGNRADINGLHAALSAPRYELSDVRPGPYLVTVEFEGKKAAFKCVVSNTQEFQRFDFDIKDEKPAGAAKSPAPLIGKLVLKEGQAILKGKLAANDPRDRVRRDSPCKVYTIAMSAGKTYQIDMIKFGETFDALDPFLRLEDAAGNHLAQDDDSGGNMNARIVFVCTAEGEYRIVATCSAGLGDFSLKVQEK